MAIYGKGAPPMGMSQGPRAIRIRPWLRAHLRVKTMIFHVACAIMWSATNALAVLIVDSAMCTLQCYLNARSLLTQVEIKVKYFRL